MGAKWRFEQLKGGKKVLELDGHAAPFGRPRRKGVLKEVIELRTQTLRPPGSKGAPYRYGFGSHWEDMELNGRWMTKALNGANALQMADDWTRFVRDEQPIRMSWGNIVSYTGLIQRLELDRESQNEIAWKMKILIDTRDDDPGFFIQASPPRIRDDLTALTLFIMQSKEQLEAAVPDMSIDFFEMLDNYASAANIPSAVLAKIAGQIDDIEKMSFATIQHFRSAVTGMHTSIINLRDVVLNTAIDSVMTVRRAESDLAWLEYQLSFDVESSEILASLRELDRRAEIAARSEASKIVDAVDGDTWESISTRATGGPGKAADIRANNGARYGERPVPGTSYLVP